MEATVRAKSLVPLLVLLAGCVAPPQYTDPLAGLSGAVKRDGPFATVSIRVVDSENTRVTLKHLSDTASMLMLAMNPGAAGDLDPRTVHAGLTQVLAPRFKSVTVAGATEEQKSDLTVIFDARVFLGQMSGQTTTVEISGIFRDGDQVIETVSGKGAATLGWPAWTFRFREAANLAFADFARNLDNASKLTAHVSTRRAGTTVAARPTVRPPVSPEALERRVRTLGGTSWALVVGINAYRHADRLNYAVNDARTVAAILPGLGFQHVRLLLDEQATKAAIERVIYGEFKERMNPEDRLFVFFAGHGITVRLPRGGEEGYLIPVDGDPRRPELTALPMDEVRKMGKRVNARHIFFAIDSCFSGFALTRDITPEAVQDADLLAALQEPVVQVLTAGRKGQKAVEEEGHGLFTKRLLDGLRGLADRDRRGFVTVTQLAAWVSPRVIRDSGGRQHPQYSALDGEGDFVFVLPGAQR
jgi:hypothetical protein